MQISKYYLTCATIFWGLTSAPVAFCQNDFVQDEFPAHSLPGSGFEPVQLSLDGRDLYGSCRDLATLHLEALRKIPPVAAGNDRASHESRARYEAALGRMELEFLSRESWSIGSIAEKLSKFEQSAFKAPVAQLKLIPLKEMGDLCRLASKPRGLAGLNELPQAIKEGAAAIRKLDQLESAALRQIDQVADGSSGKKTQAEPESGMPLTTQEFRQRRERWEAHLRQQEQEAEGIERAYAESLRAQAERPAVALPEPKVSYRKDLPPAPVRPTVAQVDPAMARLMTSWHRTYWNGVKSFKFDLSQLLTVMGSKRSFARRQTCVRLAESTTEIFERNLLEAPDRAVAEKAQIMIAEFQQASLECVEGRDAEMQLHLDTAQKALDQLARALEVYGLAP